MKRKNDFEELRKEIRRGIKIYVVFWFLMVILGLLALFFIFRR
jgi:hypothetical protein